MKFLTELFGIIVVYGSTFLLYKWIFKLLKKYFNYDSNKANDKHIDFLESEKSNEIDPVLKWFNKGHPTAYDIKGSKKHKIVNGFIYLLLALWFFSGYIILYDLILDS
tara:strand:- start:16 stop:339 length:324 start_codon:yes stop_codon:yes gene_type:complete